MGSLVPAEREPCPFCGALAHNPAYHVFLEHLGVSGFHASNTRYVLCFCNLEDYAQTDQGYHLFERHLIAKGGLRAHLLATTLGVEP